MCFLLLGGLPWLVANSEAIVVKLRFDWLKEASIEAYAPSRVG